jgi:hypothetical protein
MTIMERKKTMPNRILFSKIDDEDIWNIMGDNILQHALFKMYLGTYGSYTYQGFF